MADNLVEKKFLYLIFLSVIIHAAIFVLLLNLPQEKKALLPEPLMVDLEGIAAPAQQKSSPSPVKRRAEEMRRVEREVAPKGEAIREKLLPGGEPFQRTPSLSAEPKGAQVISPADPDARERAPRDELFKKRGSARVPDAATLYPGAANMAKIEESYRKKYGAEVADGETRFLNTDDIQFGSFLRRFENTVYGVWRYPAEAARMGIEGVTPVRITFNRRGEIVGRELLQSSGSKILDNEVLRTLDQVGPIGSFPRGYDKETFNLIAFFYYGIMQGASRSLR